MKQKQKEPRSETAENLGLFNGKDTPDLKCGWEFYQSGLAYNNAINLDDTVRVNENFYIGKQWEGVNSNGLPTPQFNILKRVVGFVVATITTDNIKVNASALNNVPGEDKLTDPVRVVNEEFDAIVERNDIPALIREYARNAAVDGDGCIYTYWDDKAETGQTATGAICSEIIDNTNVFFGNPNDKNVQSQPWIIIASRIFVRDAKVKAKRNGIESWADIKPDSEGESVDSAKAVNGKCTELMLMWKDEGTGEVMAYEFTKDSETRRPYSLKVKLYPVSWLPWDYVRNSYHGQAMLTGLIPNQIFINKAWAMSMVSMMKSAFPKVIYDRTKIRAWDNRAGGAIGVAGNVNEVARTIDGTIISPQVSQFLQAAVQETEQSLGATSVALGDTRPDNTSAIIALQRAASTPTEITKQALYKSIEELFRIYLEFMGSFYGTRIVDMEPPENVVQAMQFPVSPVPDKIQVKFDFSILKKHKILLKLEAGASSYYSEIAAMQTLDNLLMNKHITAAQYLERVPDGYVPGRRKLLADLKQAEAAAMGMMQPQGGGPVMGGAAAVGASADIPTGGGYSRLQRAINETGSTEGLV